MSNKPEFVAVVGSRDVNADGRFEVRHFIRGLPADAVVVSGYARGVDREAEEEADKQLLRVVSFRPIPLGDSVYAINRVMLDRSAPTLEVETTTLIPRAYPSWAAAAYVRNGYIVDFADRVVAFWDGKSKGTKNTLTLARRAGLPVEVYHVDVTRPKG